MKQILKEDMTKADVEKEVTKQIGGKELKSVIEKIVKERLKSAPELESKVIEITRNAFIQLFKTLWTKRGVWQNNITNKSS